MEDKKKLAAAISAVTALLTEEAALCAHLMAGQAPAPVTREAAPAAAVNVWGGNGRQAMMQMRSLMQLRAFQGGRFR